MAYNAMREVRHAGDAAHCNDTGSGGVAGGGAGAGAGAGGDVHPSWLADKKNE